MITTKNYFTEVNKIGITKLSDTFKKSHELVNKVTQGGTNWNMYNSNQGIKKMIDLYFEKLAAMQKEEGPYSLKKMEENRKKIGQKIFVVKPDTGKKEKAQETAVKKTAVKTTKPKKEAKSNVTLVERIEDEISLIKRYVNFHNKQKTREQVTNLLKAVQKAILERRVNKNSQYGKEVMQIQDSLIGALKHNIEIFDIKIEKTQLEHYTGIALGVAPMSSIQLIKRYVSLLGKRDIKDKVERLAKHFERTMNDKGLILQSDKYASQVSDCYNDLQSYLTGNTKMLTMNEQTLNGLGFIPSIIAATAGAAVQAFAHHHLAKSKNNLSGVEPEVMSVADAKNETFKEIGLTGDYLKLIGRACAPTSFFIYGNGGSGKSGLSLKIADELQKLHHSVLYAAGEQYGTPSFSELLKKVNISGGENFKIVKSLNTLPIANFDVIVIDSKESANIEHSSEFKKLRDTYPDKIWIITSQGTKAGNYAGDGKWQNECETFIYCENGNATTKNEKNRWGGKADIKLF